MPASNYYSFNGPFLPYPIKLIDSVLRAWPSAAEMPSSDFLLETVSDKFGLDDFGDPFFQDSLNAMLESINEEGRLNAFGSFAIRKFIEQNATRRLYLIEAMKQHPEILTQQLGNPIIVTGLYRSGTTFMHNMLAKLPDTRAPLFWELREPCPSPDPNEVKPGKLVKQANWANRFYNYLSPAFSQAHSMSASKPDECFHLFENSAVSTMAFFLSEAKSYAWWLLEQDLGSAYVFYRRQLQLLQWLRPGKQWVLKWPYHLWHLDTLLDVFPEARIIQIHRDPVETIPSTCSLAALTRAPFCKQIDTNALGQFWLDYCEAGYQRAMPFNQHAYPGQIVDVNYSDLVRDPLGLMGELIKMLNLKTDPDTESLMQNELQKSRNRSSGRHRYDLEQFGLNQDGIKERFDSIEDMSHDLDVQAMRCTN